MSMSKIGRNQRYFNSIWDISKKMHDITVSDKKMRFNKTEFCLLSEIITAKNKGERFISTELAKRLGITRSAVSQIVSRLENQGVVRRVPDAVDRKIAYVEITDETMKEYNEEMKDCIDFIGSVVKEFGEDKFERMCEMFKEFSELVEKVKQKGDKRECLN